MKAKINFIKHLLLSNFLVLVFVLASNVSIAQEAYLTEKFAVSDNAKIEVRTSGGSIELIGENSDEVRVEMYVRKRGRELDQDDTDLSEWEIRIEKEGNTVYAIAKREGRNWGNNNLSISFKVFAPNKSISDLRTSGGSITITVPKDLGYDLDLDGNRVRADLYNFQGEFDKNDMEGTMNGGGTKVSAKTSGGSVNLRYL